MSKILIIVKKELLRILTDKRLCFTTIIMPGLMIFIMYALVGNVMSNTYSTLQNSEYTVVINNIKNNIKKILLKNKISFKEKNKPQNYYMNKIRDKNLDLYIDFDKNFEDNILNGTEKGVQVPSVSIYYNSQSNSSNTGYMLLSSILNEYKDCIRNVFYVNSGNDLYDLATTKDSTGQFVSMILPMLLITMLFSICASVAPDSIAGEKERGTMATLLVTPIKREQLAIGKILGLSIIVVLGGISSFIGAMLSLPFLSIGQDEIDTSVYSINDYLELFIIVISTVLIMISLTAIVSVLARSIKEASSSMAPLTILVALVGISGMYNQNGSNRLIHYIIPLYNSAQCMNEIFLFNGNINHVIITVISNLLYTIILVYILSKLFKNEKIILWNQITFQTWLL